MELFLIPSTFVLLFTALCRLITAIDGIMDEQHYGLIMARMPILYEDWDLTKRDVCADAIPGTTTSTCTPGNTLCCTPNKTNSAYPQCQTILGSGYCCVSGNDCYIDTPSDCAASNSVQCTMLAAGTTEACCPPFTTCPSNFNQSATVRCNLSQGAASSSSSTSSTQSSPSTSSSSTKISSSSTTSSSGTTSSYDTSSSTEASETPNPFTQTSSSASPTGTGVSATSSKSGSLSTGADAGIGIGAALAVLAIAGLAFWAYRRGKKKGAAEEAALGTQIYSGAPNQHDIYSKMELPTPNTYNQPAELGGM